MKSVTLSKSSNNDNEEEEEEGDEWLSVGKRENERREHVRIAL